MFVFGFFCIVSGFNRHYQKDWKQNKEEVPPAEEGGLFHYLWSRLFGDQGDKGALKESDDTSPVVKNLPSMRPGETTGVKPKICEDLHNVLHETFPKVNTAYEFREVRRFVRDYGGLECIGTYLSVPNSDGKSYILKGSEEYNFLENPRFNPHALYGDGRITESWDTNELKGGDGKWDAKNIFERDQVALGEYREDFVVARNLWKKDYEWDNEEPEWKALPSMAERHRFLDIKNNYWKWFNVVAFGLDSKDLEHGIFICEQAKKAIHAYCKAMGWGPEIKIVVHPFGQESVPSLHIHFMDFSDRIWKQILEDGLDWTRPKNVGASYYMQEHKNLPIDGVIQVLQDERDAWLKTIRSFEEKSSAIPSIRV